MTVLISPEIKEAAARGRFEKWYLAEIGGAYIERTDGGSYISPHAQAAWLGWHAAERVLALYYFEEAAKVADEARIGTMRGSMEDAAYNTACEDIADAQRALAPLANPVPSGGSE